MASKKLKRVGKAAAAIGAAYLASQALSKKKTKPVESEQTRFEKAVKANKANIKPFTPRGPLGGEEIISTDKNVPAVKFLSTPGGFSIGEKGSGTTTSPVDESDYMSQNEGFGPMAKDGKFISKKMMGGGSVISRGNKLARSKPTKLF